MSKTITFDSSDYTGMLKLMDELGDCTSMFPGENDEGELTFLSIFHEKIVHATYQKNGWIRYNTYWRDGTCEETYERQEG